MAVECQHVVVECHHVGVCTLRSCRSSSIAKGSLPLERGVAAALSLRGFPGPAASPGSIFALFRTDFGVCTTRVSSRIGASRTSRSIPSRCRGRRPMEWDSVWRFRSSKRVQKKNSEYLLGAQHLYLKKNKNVSVVLNLTTVPIRA